MKGDEKNVGKYFETADDKRSKVTERVLIIRLITLRSASAVKVKECIMFSTEEKRGSYIKHVNRKSRRDGSRYLGISKDR